MNPGAPDELLELTAGGGGNVEERTEGTRREEWVTCAPEDPDRGFLLVAEPPQQRRLSRARLACHEHEATAGAVTNPLERGGQGSELPGPLEHLDLHRSSSFAQWKTSSS